MTGGTVTYPKPSQLFKSDEHGKPLLPIDEAIIAALTRLSALLKVKPDAGLLDAYADNLEDIVPRGLELAFAELEKTWGIPALPSPGEIRHIAMGLLHDEYRKQEGKRFWNEMRQAQREIEAIPPEERARTALDLRDSYRRIVAAQDARAEAKRQEILQAQKRRVSEHERKLGIEFYLQLVRRAKDEGWEWKPRKAAA